MPIYEYRCRKCQHEFGQLVRSSDDEASLACPKCGRKDLEKKLSVFAARQGPGTAPAVPDSCACCMKADGSCPMRS